jgi:O-methyltransferase involved in polyketide biosynthesis
MEFRTESTDVDLLEGLPRTLLIPLSARAHGPRIFPALNPDDRYAKALLSATGVQARHAPHDAPVVLNVLWRTQLIKRFGQAFFERHPQSTGVNLGAGLAHYFQWLGNGHNTWVDTDLPEVIHLRQSLIPQTSGRCHNTALDLKKVGWWQRLKGHTGQDGQPLLLVCEGVLMYLNASQVRVLLREIGDNAPEGSELLVDFVSPWGIDAQNHWAPDMAPFQWGAHNGLEMARMHPRLELIAQHSVAEAYGWGASWAELCGRPWTGGILYGLARLRVGEPG